MANIHGSASNGEGHTATAPAAAHDPNCQALISSASRWMREAMKGWAADDHPAVTMLAPIGVEHLGKAVLWHRHPALLVPLERRAEESLRILAERPDLSNPKLRTVGLTVVMERLERCLDSFPLSKEDVRSLVDMRNGAIHAGAKTRSRPVLTDALRLCAALLDDLGVEPKRFYGDQVENVRGLMDDQRSDVEAGVAAKMARARNHLAALEESLGHSQFEKTSDALEADARFVLDPHDFGASNEIVAINRVCPQCGRKGRLTGRLNADPEADWDVEKVGGSYQTYLAGVFWVWSISPQVFQCNVCKLTLAGADELEAVGLPASTFGIDEDELDDDFEIDEFKRAVAGDDGGW